MIRILLALLMIHFSVFSLTSCTSSETAEDTPTNESGAISDSDLADNGGASASGEDALEGELDRGEPSAAAPPAAEAAQKPAEDDSLENELSAGDNKPKEQPQAEQPPPEGLEPAPAVQAEQPPPEPPPEPMAPPEPPKPELTKVRDIRYLSNASGGTVVIETSQPVTYQTRMNKATQQFVIELSDVELPAALQRPYQLKEMGSRFGSINAYQGEGSKTARIVVQLAGAASGEPVIQQEGTSLVVVPPAAAPAEPQLADNTPVPAAKEASSPQTALGAKTLDEFLTGNQKFYGHPINLQVKDADVRDVINFLAEESGANIVMSDDVNGKVSLKVRHIPWDQALVTVMRSKGLGYTRQGNVLRISTLKTLQEETEATSKIMESQKAIVPAVVRVIPINFANIDELVKNVQQFLGKDGKVVADNRTNTLIITDKAEVTERVDKLIKTLDVAPTQVSIESKIVEAVEGFENFIGVNWQMSGSPITLSSSGGAFGAPVTLTPGASAATTSKDFASGTPLAARLGIGTLDGLGDLTATLSLAETDSLAKVISAPRISTMNREKASIVQQGESISIASTRSETTNTISKTATAKTFTLQLDVTPQITVDGSVIMELEVMRQFLGPVIDFETKAQPVNTRRAKTKIMVHNGQTAVIGGIYTSDELTATTGVPVLMNIPVLGWLFKNKNTTRSKNELLVFMTPRILAADGTSTESGPR